MTTSQRTPGLRHCLPCVLPFLIGPWKALNVKPIVSRTRVETSILKKAWCDLGKRKDILTPLPCSARVSKKTNTILTMVLICIVGVT